MRPAEGTREPRTWDALRVWLYGTALALHEAVGERVLLAGALAIGALGVYVWCLLGPLAGLAAVLRAQLGAVTQSDPQAALRFAELFHTVLVLLIAGPIAAQVHTTLTSSAILGAFITRTRAWRAVAAAVLVAGVSQAVVLDLLLAHGIWAPFMGPCSAAELGRVVALKAVALFVALAGTALVVAQRLRAHQARHLVLLRWISACAYYLLLLGLAWRFHVELQNPSRALVLRILRHWLHLADAGRELLLMAAVLVTTWLAFGPAARQLASALRTVGAPSDQDRA